MEDEAAEELRKMDLHVLREMDKEIRIQQETLSKVSYGGGAKSVILSYTDSICVAKGTLF